MNNLESYAAAESYAQWERERMGALVLEAQGQPLLTEDELWRWREEQNEWLDGLALNL